MFFFFYTGLISLKAESRIHSSDWFLLTVLLKPNGFFHTNSLFSNSSDTRWASYNPIHFWRYWELVTDATGSKAWCHMTQDRPCTHIYLWLGYKVRGSHTHLVPFPVSCSVISFMLSNLVEQLTKLKKLTIMSVYYKGHNSRIGPGKEA